jgi:hypothetical protein
MKILSAHIVSLLFISAVATAQHPLVGTWEMVSIEGVNVDGEKFKLDTTTIRETKIITPTHYILIAQDKENGQWTFNRSYAGKVKFVGDQYYEVPEISSLMIYENVTTDFKWTVKGTQFIQTGRITRPDQKTIVLDRFEFRRNDAVTPSRDTNVIGTWATSDSGGDGLFIITPTHWMNIVKLNDSFESASGGTYTITNNGITLKVLWSSGRSNVQNVVISERGNLRFNGRVYTRL